MDLYLDFDHNSRRRRRGRRRGRRNRSRAPFVIGVIILLVVIVAGGIFAGRKYMAYRQQKAEEARKLAEARRVVTVMIPEGYSIDMIAKRLEKQGVFKADEFIKAAKNTDQYKNDFIKDIDPKKGTKYKLEGYLYPDTYKIYKSSKPEDLIQKMLDNFDKKYSALAKSYKGKRSMAEIMTIASMIEREASNMSERPMIAGVIENRLAAKMRLQIDPTVLYTTTNGLYNAKKVYYKDLKVKTVYNTYVIKGLPAGPICQTRRSRLRCIRRNMITYIIELTEAKRELIFSQKHSMNIRMRKAQAQKIKIVQIAQIQRIQNLEYFTKDSKRLLFFWRTKKNT